MSYFFHPAAEAEYLEAIAYYESKRPGLGATYLTEFEGVIETICEAPHRNPVEKHPDVRRMRMKRFPFAILYRENAGSVQVLAVAHHRRRPQYWLGRL
jgi:plasmid stabilization system protein ParE